MKNILLLLILLNLSCQKQEPKDYIISRQDSIAKVKVANGKMLFPQIPESLNYYANTNFIIDGETIYFYQTTLLREFDNYGYEKNNVRHYPNYLGLKPTNLIGFSKSEFDKFLKTNDDIFEIINLANNRFSFIIISSTSDTIKEGILEKLSSYQKARKAFYYKIRRTTEEENVILSYKKSKTQFDPRRVIWTMNFLNGKNKPLTDKYLKEESELKNIRKASIGFNKNGAYKLYYE